MARRTKLKVFRTPIGFHDAYVAASSQKAALEAWGTDVNLFARGSAEIVTDEELTREPLERPGEVIKRLRGSTDEHLAALPPDPPPPEVVTAEDGETPGRKRAPTPSPVTHSAKPKRQPAPRPSRRALDDAERELEELVARQQREDGELRERERKLRAERDELARSHSRALSAAEREVERERSRHSKALAKWSGDRP